MSVLCPASTILGEPQTHGAQRRAMTSDGWLAFQSGYRNGSDSATSVRVVFRAQLVNKSLRVLRRLEITVPLDTPESLLCRRVFSGTDGKLPISVRVHALALGSCRLALRSISCLLRRHSILLLFVTTPTYCYSSPSKPVPAGCATKSPHQPELLMDSTVGGGSVKANRAADRSAAPTRNRTGAKGSGLVKCS